MSPPVGGRVGAALARPGVIPALALLAGGVWGLCHGVEARPWLAGIAVAPVLLLLDRRRPALSVFLFALGFWLSSIPWIVHVLRFHGELPGPAALAGHLALSVYLALYALPFAVLAPGVWRAGRSAAAGGWGLVTVFLGIPGLWLAAEGLRGWLLTGFPWNLAGYAWVEVPGALPLAGWVGIHGVSFLLVWLNTGVALALARRRWEPLAIGLLVPLVLLAVGGRWGNGLPVPSSRTPAPVALVQPNHPVERDPPPGTYEENYREIFHLLDRECAPGTLVVLPESALFPWAYDQSPRLRDDLAAVMARGGCTVLLNSPVPGGDAWYNSLYQLDAGGAGARYDKRHLVPFGEYVPLSEVFGFLDTIARNAGAFSPGEMVVLIPWGRELLGPAICFEIVFPREVAETVRAGATVLVTVTNDAWYGDSAAPRQHLRMARFRAAENRRPLLRAGLTGISALIEADGSVRSSLDLMRQGVIRGTVTGRLDLSPASRYPNATLWLAGAGALFAIIMGRKVVREQS